MATGRSLMTMADPPEKRRRLLETMRSFGRALTQDARALGRVAPSFLNPYPQPNAARPSLDDMEAANRLVMAPLNTPAIVLGSLLRARAGEADPITGAYARGVVPDATAQRHPVGAFVADLAVPDGSTLSGLATGAALAVGRTATRAPRGVEDVVETVAEAAPAPPPNPLAGTRVVDEAGQPRRVYHGTSAAFKDFDPAKNDPMALYGPGFYWTEDVATAGGIDGPGGYSRKGPVEDYEFLSEAYEQLRSKWQQLMFGGPAEWRAHSILGGEEGAKQRAARIRAEMDEIKARLDEIGMPGPNVRPARLAVRNPFDIDAALDNETVDRIAAAADRSYPGAGDTVRQHAAGRMGHPVYGAGVYRELAFGLSSAGAQFGKEAANRVLRDAGFDGITHIGGSNTGNRPHRVWIAFDRSQIRSPWGPAETAEQYGALVPLVPVAGLLGAGLGRDEETEQGTEQKRREVLGRTASRFGDWLRGPTPQPRPQPRSR